MTTNLLQKLLDNGILQYGIWETIYMTLLSTIFAYVIGLPIGLILSVTGKMASDQSHGLTGYSALLSTYSEAFLSLY